VTSRVADPLRDRPDTSLSRKLEEFWRAHEAVQTAVFVDAEGECVDYCSARDPYEAQVAAATWLDVTMHLRASSQRMRAGEVRQWILERDDGAIVVRRVTDEHLLVVELGPQGLSARVLLALDGVVTLLREDAGYEAADWDRLREPWLSVRPEPP